MASKFVDFVVIGDPARAKATAEQALAERQFRLAWTDDWTAIAERGSRGMNIFLGALAQYFKVGVRIMSVGDGETAVRIERQSNGWAGGAIGAMRTTRNFDALNSELQATFSNAGVLVRTAGG